jgi:transcriptional regulator with XRE-family HTH domain
MRLIPGDLDVDKDCLERQFIRNLLRLADERGMSEAGLSRLAGLNRRFVTDLREGKVRSPKLSNAYMLAEALDMDLRDIIAGRSRPAINAELALLLADYPPETQARLIEAVRLLVPPSGS